MLDSAISTPNNTFTKKPSFLGALGSFVFESIEAIIIALALSVVLYLFLVTPHEVVGVSMDPNFESGEYLIANKITYRFSEPERGDVIIFRHSATQDYIKRIVALPGETISLRDGHFYIDGKILDESEYLASTVTTSGGNGLQEGEEITLGDDKYFAAGDNRPKSSDSRAFGPIDGESIKGRAWIVYFPFSQARIVPRPIY